MDVSDIFYFFCSRRGKGESEAPGGVGDRFLMKIPGGGGKAGRGRGAGRSAANWGIWGGGGLNIFFGAETSTKEFRYGKKFRYGRSKTLRRGGSEMPCFSKGERGRKTVQKVKNYGGGKIYREGASFSR